MSLKHEGQTCMSRRAHEHSSTDFALTFDTGTGMRVHTIDPANTLPQIVNPMARRAMLWGDGARC